MTSSDLSEPIGENPDKAIEVQSNERLNRIMQEEADNFLSQVVDDEEIRLAETVDVGGVVLQVPPITKLLEVVYKPRMVEAIQELTGQTADVFSDELMNQVSPDALIHELGQPANQPDRGLGLTDIAVLYTYGHMDEHIGMFTQKWHNPTDFLAVVKEISELADREVHDMEKQRESMKPLNPATKHMIYDGKSIQEWRTNTDRVFRHAQIVKSELEEIKM